MTLSTNHCEQSRANWCVPACCCIVLRSLGESAQEEHLVQQLSATKKGFSLEEAANHLAWQYLSIDPNDPKSYVWLRSMRNIPLIVQVFGGPLTKAISNKYLHLTSRFGPLTTDFSGPPLHAVVLVAADQSSISILDPYYPADGQPLDLANSEFVAAFQGAVVVPKRRRRG